MKVHALKCISGIDDPNVCWKAGDWIGKNMGNPVPELSDAKFFDKAAAFLRKDCLEILGCKFKIVSFELVEVSNE